MHSWPPSWNSIKHTCIFSYISGLQNMRLAKNLLVTISHMFLVLLLFDPFKECESEDIKVEMTKDDQTVKDSIHGQVSEFQKCMFQIRYLFPYFRLFSEDFKISHCFIVTQREKLCVCHDFKNALN